VLGKVYLRYYIYKLEICTVNVHGCDEMLADSLQFETMAYASAAMTGKLSFWFWVTAAILFYGATWESFFTDTLILPELNGPTEGLMVIYLAHFFTAIVGN
jgi:ethanolaminephosphotransferase